MGVIVLVIGLGGAALLYRQARPAASNATSDWKDSTLTLTDSKANMHDIEMYGGKLAVLMVRWQEWLRRPRSQAILVVAGAMLVALTCFVMARR